MGAQKAAEGHSPACVRPHLVWGGMLGSAAERSGARRSQGVLSLSVCSMLGGLRPQHWERPLRGTLSVDLCSQQLACGADERVPEWLSGLRLAPAGTKTAAQDHMREKAAPCRHPALGDAQD